MILLSLLLIPLIGIIIIFLFLKNNENKSNLNNIKKIALITSILNLFVSLLVFILFDFSFNQFQFVQEPYIINTYTLYLGLDGVSIYFVLLTTIIVPVALLSN
jgi:NADH-ubiquinone oxidoreductase chain 4